MDAVIKKVTRHIGTKEIEGVMIKEGNSYRYDYPVNREYEKNLFESDKMKIANKLGITHIYVNAVLKGKKFNEAILMEAQKIAEYNIANGYCKN